MMPAQSTTKGLGRNYRYYRLTLTTEEGALEIGTAAFFARKDYTLFVF